MINLLPPADKESILYARRNVHLRKWIFGIGIVLVLVAVIIGVGQMYVKRSITNLETRVAQDQETLRIGKLDEVQQKAESISNGIKLIDQVLSKQIVFSELLQQIGRVTPSGAVLTDLDISKLSGGIDLQFEALNQATATQIQVNLQDAASKLFSKADINQIVCDAEVQEGNTYPCTVDIRALFTEKNPFLFINRNAEDSQ